MKFLLSFSFLLFVTLCAYAQTPQSASAPTQSVVLSEEGDSPVILFDKKEISQQELAQMDQQNIGDIEILNGEEAKERFGKYGKNGAIVISSTPPADVISASSVNAAPAEQKARATEDVKMSLSDADAHVVIDGKPSTMEVLKAMSPDQIKAMEVLKGEVATKKYGEVAKDGAIEVTTKQ